MEQLGGRAEQPGTLGAGRKWGTITYADESGRARGDLMIRVIHCPYPDQDSPYWWWTGWKKSGRDGRSLDMREEVKLTVIRLPWGTRSGFSTPTTCSDAELWYVGSWNLSD